MGSLDELLHKDWIDISHNVRVKAFPDGGAEILASSVPIFREAGWEESRKSEKDSFSDRDNKNIERSMRRARIAVRDIARATPFSFFVTLTLNKEKVDRYDEKAVIRRLNTWLDNRVRRNGLAYVLVPERHKDGAVHFHGFFNDALSVVPSGHTDAAGHAIYNLPAWDFGFTTAIRIYGDYVKAVAYVCKYIGKQNEKIGGRWYYSGGCLGRPQVLLSDGDFAEYAAAPDAFCFDVPEARARFARLEVRKNAEPE